jgi:hypothetical protein
MASSKLPDNWTHDQLDQLFKVANDGEVADIPTAVGFCMYIRRDCLHDTGYFDTANFGQGYGEECDFSLRAQKNGWRNVIAADVFVFHEGGASFAQTSDERKLNADAVLDRLHPEYHGLVTEFVSADPLARYRANADRARLSANPEDGAAIIAEHMRSTEALRTYNAALVEDLQGEREQRRQLEVMLDECRASFSAVDRALSEAQALTITLHNDIRAQAEQLKAMGDSAHAQEERLVALHEKIESMEQSRSWRYTAWLRRGQDA